MGSLLKKYKVEFITAVVCGTVCLVMLLPFLPSRWLERLPFRNFWSGRVVISQTVTGKPLMRGDSAREAVESRLKRIREVVGELGVVAPEDATLTSLSTRLATVPPDQADRVHRLLKSFYGADLADADLHDMDFRGINVQHADFTNANLANARFEGAMLGGANFADANLTGVRFGKRRDYVRDHLWPAGGNAPGARFDGCVFENDRLSGWLSGASFKDATLRGTTFCLWQCENLDMRGADLTGGAITFAPSAVPSLATDWNHDAFYATVLYDDNTKVDGLRLSSVTDPSLPFVAWALSRGARIDESVAEPVETAAVSDALTNSLVDVPAP